VSRTTPSSADQGSHKCRPPQQWPRAASTNRSCQVIGELSRVAQECVESLKSSTPLSMDADPISAGGPRVDPYPLKGDRQ
jgi:hypothetical protein